MIDKARLGAPLGEGLSAIALVLAACWQDPRYQQSRSGEGVLDQEVDKLSLLLFNAMKEADPDGEHFCRLPFTTIPGRHGPGPALATNRGRPQFICDVIQIFQKLAPTLTLFNISRTSERSAYFEPRLTRVAWDQWRSRKSTAAVDFVEAVGGVFSKLSERQAIAFGRHPSLDDSREALRFLHRSFRSSTERLFSTVSTSTEFTPDVSDAVSDLYSIGASGHAKVVSDPGLYTEARAIVRDGDSVAREPLLNSRGAWEDIGRDREWRTLAPKSRALFQLATAIRAGYRVVKPVEIESAIAPLDEIAIADAGWRSESCTASAAIPVDELSCGNLDAAAPKIRQCLDAVETSIVMDS